MFKLLIAFLLLSFEQRSLISNFYHLICFSYQRNIIDVAALDSHHILEQSEYNERMKLYNQRLAQQWNNIPITDAKYNGLLKDNPNPEQLLTFFPNVDEILNVSSTAS